MVKRSDGHSAVREGGARVAVKGHQTIHRLLVSITRATRRGNFGTGVVQVIRSER